MTTVSFPGIGIGEFAINPVAFKIGSIEVRWYGILIVLGMILAFSYCAWRSRREEVIFDDLLDITIFTIVFSVIGARLYYVLTSLGEYDSFWEIFAIWNGGLAIYGGIIAGAITIYSVCRFKKYSNQKILGFMDSVAPAVMIGQIIGRWGNFCNGEAFGRVVGEDSPLYFIRMSLSSSNTGYTTMAVHPTFLYESLWNLLGFIIINLLYKKKKFNGQIVLMYITWYGFGRMFIEGLRTDSLYVGVFRISQVVGFLCFVIGGIALVFFLAKAYRSKKDGEAYDPAYKKVSNPAAVDSFDTSFLDEGAKDDESTQSAEDLNENTDNNDDGE